MRALAVLLFNSQHPMQILSGAEVLRLVALLQPVAFLGDSDADLLWLPWRELAGGSTVGVRHLGILNES